MSDPTKAELQDTLARVCHERDQAHRTITDLDKEARAIAKCVAALDPIQPQRGSGFTFGVSGSVSTSPIERTLHYLAERYGVSLVQRQREALPCDRPHLEDASEGQLVQALRYIR